MHIYTSPCYYLHRAIQVVYYAHIAQYQHNNVKNVPKAVEIFHPVLANLQHLLNGVVDHEQHEDRLARHHEVIHGGHITDQFDRPEVVRWNTAACGRKLEEQPKE